MPDAFDQNSQEVGLSLDLIEEEIEDGLVLHADRLAAAFDNEEYYACRNAAYIPRRPSEDWVDYLRRPKRTSKMTRKAIQTLGRHLYTPGPTRRVNHAPAADALLAEIYAKNHINALMKQADRKATLNGFCAVQAHATGRPEKPILLYLWGAHELVVWPWPDDPTEAWAACTITRQRRPRGAAFEQRLEYNAWTRDEHRVYRTAWHAAPAGPSYCEQQYRGLFGRPARLLAELSGEPAGSGKNPYGVLPFAFVHDEIVVDDFYAGGIGTALRQCNAEIDRELSDLAQHAREFMDPDRFLRGVSPSWRREKRAGNWQILTPGKNAEGEAAHPEAFLVQARLAVADVWNNAQTYMNNTFEDLDVPLVSVRLDAATDRDLSGVAIVAKQLPLLERTRERQPLFGVAEADLAELVLHVAGTAYDRPELVSIARALDLELNWPQPRFPLPSPGRDAEDQWEIDRGIKSLVDVVAQRQGITHDAARAVLERVAEDRRWLARVGIGRDFTAETAEGAETKTEKTGRETEFEAEEGE